MKNLRNACLALLLIVGTAACGSSITGPETGSYVPGPGSLDGYVPGPGSASGYVPGPGSAGGYVPGPGS